MSRRSRNLNLLESQEPLQACSGKPLPLPYPIVGRLKGGASHLTVFIMLLEVSSDICATQMERLFVVDAETLNGNSLANCSNGLLVTVSWNTLLAQCPTVKAHCGESMDETSSVPEIWRVCGDGFCNCRHQVPPKRWWIAVRPHRITSPEAVSVILQFY